LGTEITKHDLQGLSKGDWLNDNLINAILDQLTRSYPNRNDIICLPSTFTYRSGTGGRIPDIFRYKHAMLPVNCPNEHWFLVIICNMDRWVSSNESALGITGDSSVFGHTKREPTILVLDSKPSKREETKALVIERLLEFLKTRKEIELGANQVRMVDVEGLPTQAALDGNNCGLYTIFYAQCALEWFEGDLDVFTETVSTKHEVQHFDPDRARTYLHTFLLNQHEGQRDGNHATFSSEEFGRGASAKIALLRSPYDDLCSPKQGLFPLAMAGTDPTNQRVGHPKGDDALMFTYQLVRMAGIPILDPARPYLLEAHSRLAGNHHQFLMPIIQEGASWIVMFDVQARLVTIPVFPGQEIPDLLRHTISQWSSYLDWQSGPSETEREPVWKDAIHVLNLPQSWGKSDGKIAPILFCLYVALKRDPPVESIMALWYPFIMVCVADTIDNLILDADIQCLLGVEWRSPTGDSLEALTAGKFNRNVARQVYEEVIEICDILKQLHSRSQSMVELENDLSIMQQVNAVGVGLRDKNAQRLLQQQQTKFKDDKDAVGGGQRALDIANRLLEIISSRAQEDIAIQR
jgi:hypothetical protein